jgi:hypothetical protein
LDKGNEDADGNGAAQDAASADPDDQRDGNGGEYFDRRIVERIGPDGVLECQHVGAVDGLEVVVGALLAIEELDHAHTGDVFLRKGIDARDRRADPTVGIPDTFPEDAGNEDDDRQDGEGDEGEPPAHAQHHEDDAEQDEYVPEDFEDPGGEHLIKGVHVGGETGDEAADGVAIEEGNVHALQMAKDLGAHVVHDLLPGPLHEIGLRELKDVGEAESADVDEGDLGDTGGGRCTEMAAEPGGVTGNYARGVVRHVAVNGDLGEVRSEDVRYRLEDDSDERDAGLPFVWAQIFEQAAHEPAVIRLADDIFFVGGGFVIRLFLRTGLLSPRGPSF